MKKRLALIAAAALTYGAFSFVGYDPILLAADHEHVSTSLPQGITRSERIDESGIRATLAGAVEAALRTDQSALPQYLTSNDRARLQEGLSRENTQLVQKIERLREAFRAKYNQDFDIKDEMVFGDDFKGFQIVQGEVSNPTLLSNWPIEATTSTTSTTSTRVDTDRTQGNVSGVTSTRIDRSASSDDLRDRKTVGGPGDPGTRNRQLSGDDHATGSVNVGDKSVPNNNADRDRATVGGPGDPGTRNREGHADDRNNTVSGSARVGDSSVSGSVSTDNTRRDSTSAAADRDRASVGGPGDPGTKLRPGTDSGAHASASVDSTSSSSSSSSSTLNDHDASRTTVTTTTDRTISSGAPRTINQGMNVAIVSFRASHGAPALTVSLVKENAAAAHTGDAGAHASVNVSGDNARAAASVNGNAVGAHTGWKIDLPENFTGTQLQQNLGKHIDEVLSMKDQWPADSTEAYRAISHHILMALYDTGSSVHGAAGAELDRTGATGTTGTIDRSGTATPSSSSVGAGTSTR